MASSSKPKLSDEEILTKLAQDFHELVTNKDSLRKAIENFLNNTVDDLTLGIIFDLHKKYKTGHYEIVGEDADDDHPLDEGLDDGEDIFGQSDLKKIQDVTCPNCNRSVAAPRFAPHLQTCMGMGRSGRSSRNATRRVASTSSNACKDRENTTFSGVPSDDEDDMDWNTGNKRGKKKKRNGSKKTKGNLKKGDTRLSDSTLDLEADDDELANLKELIHDHSNSSSPTDSACSNQSLSSKKKDKSKNKKNKRDRSSPNTNLLGD